eukprot:jgi/Pico_ML_1/54221/g4626.t1
MLASKCFDIIFSALTSSVISVRVCLAREASLQIATVGNALSASAFCMALAAALESAHPLGVSNLA